MTEDEIRAHSRIIRVKVERLRRLISGLNSELSIHEAELLILERQCKHRFVDYYCEICETPDPSAGFC